MIPDQITLHTLDNVLVLTYALPTGCQIYRLPGEYLRVHTPSSEARTQDAPIAGKQFVRLLSLEPVGHYALKLIFNDHHDTGLYTFEYLYDLSRHQSHYWALYIAALHEYELLRDPSHTLIRMTSLE
ncbi:MAG: DUF971 domain-containing protein [Endozoicomonadaceae bacterium]|nr:DUF971 domain-containing protein [Endozoicomonadaceae bacterium]MBE8232525.1 DUF971 domain-containing protein [Endozoicomonadaceae bacterium]